MAGDGSRRPRRRPRSSTPRKKKSPSAAVAGWARRICFAARAGS